MPYLATVLEEEHRPYTADMATNIRMDRRRTAKRRNTKQAKNKKGKSKPPLK